MTSAVEPKNYDGDGAPAEWTPADAETVSRSLQLLIETAAEQGRDWKLIDALLITLTAFIADRGTDVLAPCGPKDPRRRLRPEYRAQIDAVVDSLSDDEAACVLGIGARQVRRRAHDRTLYCFAVGKKRRYPAWQFDERLGVVPGLREVAQAIPKDWPGEQAQRFMTTLEAALELHGEPVTPRTWLIVGLDPTRVAELVREEARKDG